MSTGNGMNKCSQFVMKIFGSNECVCVMHTDGNSITGVTGIQRKFIYDDINQTHSPCKRSWESVLFLLSLPHPMGMCIAIQAVQWYAYAVSLDICTSIRSHFPCASHQNNSKNENIFPFSPTAPSVPGKCSWSNQFFENLI